MLFFLVVKVSQLENKYIVDIYNIIKNTDEILIYINTYE